MSKPANIRVRAAEAKAVGNGAVMPFLLKIVLWTLFLPEELSFYLFGLRLTVTRLAFLVLAPILVFKLTRKVSAGQYRFILSDFFVGLTGIWFIYAPANVDGFSLALNHAGPEVLEFCVGYMVTRVLLVEHGHALSFVDLLCRVIAIVALLGLLDPMANHYVLHTKIEDWQDNHRLGLLRASGPIEHPILFGFTCATGLLIAVATPIRFRRFVIVSCGLGVVFSFSSAPLFGLATGLCLLMYNGLTRRIPFRWAILIGAGFLAVAAVFVISKSPVGFIISHFIYSPESGYYREWTWDRVMFFVSQSPWYGLGYGIPPDDINHSIDSLWLVLAIHSGYPGVIFVALSLIGAASSPNGGRNNNLTPVESKLTTTLSILIVLALYMAFTVHLWGSSWILVGLLAGLRAHFGELGNVRPLPRGATLKRRQQGTGVKPIPIGPT